MSAPATPVDRRFSLAREASLRHCLPVIHAPDRPVDRPRSPDSGDIKVEKRASMPSLEQLPALPFSGRHENPPGPARKLQRRHSPVAVDGQPEDQRRLHGHKYKRFRIDYLLGEALRTPNDMIPYVSHQEAMTAIDSLNKHDFAFVKRSDGSFSYAILAYRSFVPVKGSSRKEECMTFVVSKDGSTKMLRKRYWAKCIRLTIVEG